MTIQVTEQPNHDKDHGPGSFNDGNTGWVFRCKIIDRIINEFH
jgi:hypothetical protein